MRPISSLRVRPSTSTDQSRLARRAIASVSVPIGPATERLITQISEPATTATANASTISIFIALAIADSRSFLAASKLLEKESLSATDSIVMLPSPLARLRRLSLSAPVAAAIALKACLNASSSSPTV